MKRKLNTVLKVIMVVAVIGSLLYASSNRDRLSASSHREAPLISKDPQADNTDLYCFRSPEDPDRIIIIANYIPGELPMGGPNYYSFGENVHYEIHVKNSTSTSADDITYRFVFANKNEDKTTFFNIRLGAQNIRTQWRCSRSLNGGPFESIAHGDVPANNIGPRSINDPVLGLGVASYDDLINSSIKHEKNGNGEIIYCGPADDPFFVDLGGVFDLGQTRAGGTGIDAPRDGLAGYNCHVIAMSIPISTLQKDHKTVQEAQNMLDGDFVIGVWASASRPQVRTLHHDGTYSEDFPYVQISRLGMPLTNEVVIPIGYKDYWNWTNPADDAYFQPYFTNPELALYMDDDQFGTFIPGLAPLRIQQNSLGQFDFTNGHGGLYPLKGTAAVAGTALDDAVFGTVLLQPNAPRSVDLLPIFYTGVPNLSPYQLATGKAVGNPLSAGKPFVNNFLPTFGDMLRLNMAVPVTPRDDPKFSNDGLIQACVLGLTDPAYNTTTDLQFIPNMDGFPNGRRLEDDITRIELQAVGGVVLAALGLFYDDYTIGGNPVTPDLVNVLSYTTGVNSNDTTFKTTFPFVQAPWSGYNYHYNYTY
ncbi:MAG TPA: DUF4331 domain-containing protein [Chitinophagales bacterium]|nr:DUF4331 domain-containing protein [Chitinophagales bacterium]